MARKLEIADLKLAQYQDQRPSIGLAELEQDGMPLVDLNANSFDDLRDSFEQNSVQQIMGGTLTQQERLEQVTKERDHMVNKIDAL